MPNVGIPHFSERRCGQWFDLDRGRYTFYFILKLIAQQKFIHYILLHLQRNLIAGIKSKSTCNIIFFLYHVSGLLPSSDTEKSNGTYTRCGQT